MLSLREKLSYGLGDFACGLYWQTFMLYLTFYYTDVFGLSTLEAATLLGVSRGFDALFDPVVGLLADRTRTRWGTFRPYLLWAGLPLALAGVFMFSVPEASHALRVVWAWATFNLVMLLYSAVNIPYTALLATMTTDPHQRTSLASIRFCFAFAAGVLISASLLPATRVLGADDPSAGWQRTFCIVGVLAGAALAGAFAQTRERIAPMPREPRSSWRELAALFRTGPWLLLGSAALAFNVYVAIRSSVSLHYLKYYVGPRTLSLPSFVPLLGGTHEANVETLVSAFNAGAQVMSALGVLALPWVSRRVGRKRTLLIAFAIMLGCAGSFFFLAPEQVALMFILNGLGALTGGPLSALIWSMYADSVDYVEWRTGQRSTGLAFATLIFITKQAWAIGAALTLGAMSTVGFEANAVQTPESLRGLRWLMSVIPTGIGLGSLLLMALYPLDDARVARLGAALEAQRARSSS